MNELPDIETLYKGKKIIIKSEGDKSNLSIDNEQIDTGLDEDVRSYFTDRLPYQTFSSLESLACALIDKQLSE